MPVIKIKVQKCC